MINGLTDYIASNPGMTAIGWLATVLGLIVAIVTPIITRKKKRLSYAYGSTQLVEAEVAKANNIQILFNNKPIERLCVTKFVIKNAGNTTVSWENMHRNHKLKIIGADVQIISVAIEEVSRDIVTEAKEIEPINHAKDTALLDIRDLGAIDPDDEYGVIPINFEVFEKKDYMILNIYHTGGIDTVFKLVGEDEGLKIIGRTIFDRLFSTADNAQVVLPVPRNLTFVDLLMGKDLVVDSKRQKNTNKKKN